MSDQPERRASLAGVAQMLAGGLLGEPLVIGLLLINIAFIVAMFMAIRENRVQEHAAMRLLLERCLPKG